MSEPFEIDSVAYFEAWRASPPILDAPPRPAVIAQWLYDLTDGEGLIWLDGEIAEGRVVVIPSV